jgi:hypothetical protein
MYNKKYYQYFPSKGEYILYDKKMILYENILYIINILAKRDYLRFAKSLFFLLFLNLVNIKNWFYLTI